MNPLVRSRSLSLLLSACAGFAALPAVRAQVVADGYAAPVRPLPATVANVAVLANGLAWFDGSDVVLAEDGQPQRPLLHFAAPRFGSFLLPLDNGDLLFAESSFDELWLVPTAAAGTPRLLTTLHFAYDAVQLGSNRALVSARTGGFTAGANDLIAVDLTSGQQMPVGIVGGASGPVLVDRNGDLYYATAPTNFPPPLGTVAVLRWTPQQWALSLAGGPPLTELNAQFVVTGLDSAGDLALDGDDDLLFVDYLNARIGERNDVHRGNGDATLVDYLPSSLSPVTLAFRPGSATTALDRQFEPFGAAAAGTLYVLETDYFATTQLRSIAGRPAAATTASAGPLPSGPFTIDLIDGPPQGIALFVVGLVRTDVLVPMQLPGFEASLGWDAGLLYPAAWSLEPCSTNGTGAMSLSNPGFAQGLAIHTQVVFVTADGAHLGATAPHTIQLGL